jgi:Subtilase family
MARRRFRSIVALLGVGSTALAVGVGAAAQGAGASPAGSAAASAATEHVIVILKNQHPEAPAAPATVGRRVQAVQADQARLVAQVRGRGAREVRQLHVANAFAAAVPATEAARLAADPAVAEVVPDRLIRLPQHDAAQTAGTRAAPGPVSGTICPSDPAHPLLEPEALQLTHTAFADPHRPSARHIATGRGVTVAFLADGLDVDNPDFIRPDGSHVFVDYRDFSGDGPAAPTPAGEAFGDASAIAAQGRQVYDLSTFVNPAHPLPPGCTIRVLGMAPDANLVGLKIFPEGGFAFNSAVLAALDWAVTHDHADVINESFGSNQYPDTNDDPAAVFNEELVRAGVTVVASSGDSGPYNTIGSPASSPGVISVGGTTMFRSYAQTTWYGFGLSNGKYRSNAISALSSSGVTQPGRTIDLVAPGDLGWALCSTNIDVYQDCTDNKGDPAPIQQFGGTSQSAPLTAGAAALVIQAYRDSHHGASPSPDLVRRLLTSTADDLGLPAAEQGAGLLDSLRAVRAARSAPGPRASRHDVNAGLLASPQQLDLTTGGTNAHGSERVTNLSNRPTVVLAHLRSSGRVLAEQTQDVAIDSNSTQTLIDPFGRVRPFVRTTFTVPSGATRVSAAIAWPGSGLTVVRIVLLDPDGTYSAYSLPQGAGNYGYVDVPAPKAGRWTAIVLTGAGAAGFTGTVQLTTVSIGASRGGEVSPSVFVLAPGQSRTLRVEARSNVRPGDDSDALVLTSLPLGGHASASVVPVVVRTLVPLHRKSPGVVTGSFAGGNGRAGIPNPSQTYAFDVPRGARSLSVGLTVTGDPNQVLYGFLVDPRGEPLSERTNQRVDADGNVTIVNGLQLTRLNPRPGRWLFVFAVFGPVAGTATGTPYVGLVAVNTVAATASGVPHSRRTVLPAGQPVRATISFVNTGATDQAYFVDGRLDARGTLPLVVANADYTIPGAPQAPFPAVRVPTQSDRLTVSAHADGPINFEVSPFPADHVNDLSFEGDPDREAGPAGTSPSVTVADPEVAPQTWLALPAIIGPFGGPAPTVHSTFRGFAHTRLFDPAVTAEGGDPLLSYVDASAPAAAPVTVGVGEAGSITVTFTPTGAPGTVVRGVLYLDTYDAVTGGTDEVAAIPYAYTVG